jgi:hypothetical protein
MRLALVLLLVLLGGCVTPPPKQVEVDPTQLPVIGGVLTEDTLLSGDFLLPADLQVPAGLTLTIQPGSRIFIQPSDSTKIDPEYLSREVEIIVRGRLLALGSAERPIRFLPLGEDDRQILWAGIELVDSDGSRLEHLVIEQADAGVLCLGSSPELRSLHILRSRYGVLLQQDSAPQISDSVLADGEAGLFCWDQSAPTISNNQILRLQEEGIYLGPECRALLTGNLVEAVDRAVVLPEGAVFDTTNQLQGNRVDFARYRMEGRR